MEPTGPPEWELRPTGYIKGGMLLRDLEARFCCKGVSGLDLRPCRSDCNELAFEKSLFSGETSLGRHAAPNPIWRLASNDSPH